MTARTEERLSYPMKVVLLGQSSVGKSSIALRIVKDKFLNFTEGTIGAAYLTKTIELNDTTSVKMEIWDTAGQERYHSLAPMYYRSSQAAIVVYDITSKDSFEKATQWVVELRQKTTDDIIIAFVGNKLDLQKNRTVLTQEAQRYADDNGLIYMETSAKEGTNVLELFRALAEKLPKKNPIQKQPTRVLRPEEATPQGQGGYCC